MRCKKCGSENVNVQIVSEVKKKRTGIMYWLFFGWLIDLFLWLFLTLPRLIIQILKPNRYKTKTTKQAVCQDCGSSWKL